MPCAVPCTINPCSTRCDQQLDCGHQCPSVCGETCPPAAFCQDCASEAILGRAVDLITFTSYADIDLDMDPIIVPTCGHFYTMSTYDNIMAIQNAYHIGPDDSIIGPRALDGSETREPQDGEDAPEKIAVKNCPDCRSPLRDIHRYNRIVKVACLDESTRRFCMAAQENFLRIYKEISDAQDLLQANRSDFLNKLRQRATKRPLAGNRFPLLIEERVIRSNTLLQKIWDFAQTVMEQEQPYVKVRDMVRSEQRRRNNPNASFIIDNSVVQMGFRLKAYNLAISFRWTVLWDLHTIAGDSAANTNSRHGGGEVDVNTKRKLYMFVLGEIPQMHKFCMTVIEECQNASLAKYEVEARIGRAQFFALHQIQTAALRQLQDKENAGTGVGVAATQQPFTSTANALRFGEDGLKQERQSLDTCDTLCEGLPGTVGPLKSRVDEARKMLRGHTFYEPVSAEEREEVYRAMAREFSSTGRWYTCENGHPVGFFFFFHTQ